LFVFFAADFLLSVQVPVQVIASSDHLQNDLEYVEHDINLY